MAVPQYMWWGKLGMAGKSGELSWVMIFVWNLVWAAYMETLFLAWIIFALAAQEGGGVPAGTRICKSSRHPVNHALSTFWRESTVLWSCWPPGHYWALDLPIPAVCFIMAYVDPCWLIMHPAGLQDTYRGCPPSEPSNMLHVPFAISFTVQGPWNVTQDLIFSLNTWRPSHRDLRPP